MFSARRIALIILLLLIAAGLGAAWYYDFTWDDFTALSLDDLSITAKALLVAPIVVFLVWWLI